MCGIVGVVELGSVDRDLAETTRRMALALRHRGPDHGDVWVDLKAGVALGHRRLSIQDLSEAGHQPMPSASGRFVIVYNGEVYNAPELAAELAPLGYRFRGHSDTEVILAAIEEWGLEAAVARFAGMFAFALWDRESRCITLVRDRLGIKPLYYRLDAHRLTFGSELDALRAHPAFSSEIDRSALAAYLRFLYVPAPHCIYEGTRQLAPGAMLTISVERPVAEPRVYWDPVAVYRDATPFQGSEPEGLEAVEAAIGQAVEQRTLADVPLGVSLSGGIDSSLVASLLLARASSPVRTFSVGYDDAAYDESEHAARIAAHLGTDHTTLRLTSSAVRDRIATLPELYDEPFADWSGLPTAMLAELEREHVTVVLTGDGGDEIFGGYNRYLQAPRMLGRAQRLPAFARRAGASVLRGVPIRWWERGFRLGGAVVPTLRDRPAGITVGKVAGVLESEDLSAAYNFLVSTWREPTSPLSMVQGAQALEGIDAFAEGGLSPLRQMMLADLLGYLPGDILTKVDRATMSASLEARVPLLDHRVVELAATLPTEWLIRDGRGKQPLRRILARHVPTSLWDRPKHGFGMPIAGWLRGSLRDWAEDLLSPSSMRAEGFIDPAPVQQIWRRHLDGVEDGRARLWSVLMFQAWLRSR